jgi:hypothetical protein
VALLEGFGAARSEDIHHATKRWRRLLVEAAARPEGLVAVKLGDELLSLIVLARLVAPLPVAGRAARRRVSW